MIITVVGPRNLDNSDLIEKFILKITKDLGKIDYIYHGDSKFDTIVSNVCKKLKIKTTKFQARWNDIVGKPDKYIKQSQYGKYYTLAGLERDKEMLSKSSCLASIDSESGLIQDAKKMDKIVYIYQSEVNNKQSFNFWDD